MPRYIKDPEIDRLTEELVSLSNASKIEAAKTALRHEVAHRKSRLPMRARLAKSLVMARAAGPFVLDDHKRKSDEMWSED